MSSFQTNLRALIGETSVLAWSRAHGLDQTTTQRIVNGQDPKLSTMLDIAQRAGFDLRDLLAPAEEATSPKMSTDAVRVALRFDAGTPLEKRRFLRLLDAAFDDPRYIGGLAALEKREHGDNNNSSPARRRRVAKK